MSQTDMVSYLVFGVPSFALGDRETTTLQLAAQNLIPAGLNLITSKLGGRLGNLNLQITPGTADYSFAEGTGKTFQSLLYTTRVGGEMQLSDNWFASLSTGLCQLGGSNSNSNGGSDLENLTKGLSGKLEYRFNPSMALKAGREPEASALNCGKSVTGRAFIPTPSQWGLSLFKSWRF